MGLKLIITKDEAENIPAGRDLDALIAEMIFGEKKNHLEAQWEEGNTSDGKDGWDGFFCPRCGCPDYLYKKEPCCLHYSTDISAAWEITKKINSFFIDQTAPHLGIDVEFFIDGSLKSYKATADTAPLAICRAALMTTLKKEEV
jgi:hypothetical protein